MGVRVREREEFEDSESKAVSHKSKKNSIGCDYG